MRIRVLPYTSGSRSAKALSEALGGKVLRLVDSKFVPRPEDMVINWGNSGDSTANTIGFWGGTLNNASLIKRASNKRKFFKLMTNEDLGSIIPQFWTNKENISNEAFPVVCRTVLAGHSGEGIHIADTRDDLVDAPLYVQYVKKKEEYRVHVGKKGEDFVTISAQRKARRLSIPDEEIDWKVRNLAGGFVYTREGFTLPSSVVEAAHDCLRATGLDFGAVDVIWNATQEKAVVLEINTAPGLEGQTIQDYASFFKSLCT